MKPSIYRVPCASLGDLYIMPKPSAEQLDEDVKYYRSIGINAVVSMLKKNEEKELGLQEEARICARHKIQFLRMDVLDLGLPALAPFTSLVEKVAVKLAKGEAVAVHCRAGIGRSGMLISCTLIHLGISADAAIAHVSKSRGVAIPDTDEQIAFIHNFESAYNNTVETL